ncbi:MAG: hypothetical protein ACPG7E_05555, partial [Marinirhabdus sp.]
MKYLAPLFALALLSPKLNAQCTSPEIEVLGVIKTIGKCEDPEILVQITDENGKIVREDIFVDNIRPPYNFSGCLNKTENSNYYLKVVFLQPNDFDVVPETNLLIDGYRKVIRAKRVSDIYGTVKRATASSIGNKSYTEALEEISPIDAYKEKLSPSQRYTIAYMESEIHYNLNEYKKASTVLENLLGDTKNLKKNQQYQANRFLNDIYDKQRDYDSQKNVLDKIRVMANNKTLSRGEERQFYKDWFNNFLNRANYSAYGSIPALELANDLENNNAARVTLEELNAIVTGWNGFNGTTQPKNTTADQ